MKQKILKNSAKCLICKQEIESKHRHDFVECKCGNLFVDGGKDYLRRGHKNMKKVKETSVIGSPNSHKSRIK